MGAAAGAGEEALSRAEARARGAEAECAGLRAERRALEARLERLEARGGEDRRRRGEAEGAARRAVEELEEAGRLWGEERGGLRGQARELRARLERQKVETRKAEAEALRLKQLLRRGGGGPPPGPAALAGGAFSAAARASPPPARPTGAVLRKGGGPGARFQGVPPRLKLLGRREEEEEEREERGEGEGGGGAVAQKLAAEVESLRAALAEATSAGREPARPLEAQLAPAGGRGSRGRSGLLSERMQLQADAYTIEKHRRRAQRLLGELARYGGGGGACRSGNWSRTSPEVRSLLNDT